jgi:hypothetical protein
MRACHLDTAGSVFRVHAQAALKSEGSCTGLARLQRCQAQQVVVIGVAALFIFQGGQQLVGGSGLALIEEAVGLGKNVRLRRRYGGGSRAGRRGLGGLGQSRR